jgi:hypothetical protein
MFKRKFTVVLLVGFLTGTLALYLQEPRPARAAETSYA